MSASRFRIDFIINTKYSLLFTIMLVLTICPLHALSDQIPPQDLDALQTQLEQTGWKVQRSPSGDLLLWPSGREATAQPAEGIPQDDRIPATDLETLKSRLQKKGWRVEEDTDGSLLLYPREEEAKESVQPRPASSQPSPQRGSDVLVKPSELLRVRGVLEKAGWRLEKERDGSILLFPQTSKKPEGVRRGKRYVPGIVVSTLFKREIELPVDSWDEAHRISNSWLADQQAKGLMVGKIRKINWIYLVSIVEDSAPYRLNNQLAIRAKDGTVIPLH